jgi:hypothetical protein
MKNILSVLALLAVLFSSAPALAKTTTKSAAKSAAKAAVATKTKSSAKPAVKKSSSSKNKSTTAKKSTSTKSAAVKTTKAAVKKTKTTKPVAKIAKPASTSSASVAKAKKISTTSSKTKTKSKTAAKVAKSSTKIQQPASQDYNLNPSSLPSVDSSSPYLSSDPSFSQTSANDTQPDVISIPLDSQSLDSTSFFSGVNLQGDKQLDILPTDTDTDQTISTQQLSTVPNNIIDYPQINYSSLDSGQSDMPDLSLATVPSSNCY